VFKLDSLLLETFRMEEYNGLPLDGLEEVPHQFCEKDLPPRTSTWMSAHTGKRVYYFNGVGYLTNKAVRLAAYKMLEDLLDEKEVRDARRAARAARAV
jgi:hypothetical protein